MELLELFFFSNMLASLRFLPNHKTLQVKYASMVDWKGLEEFPFTVTSAEHCGVTELHRI